MSKFIDYAIGHARLTVATLIFLLSAGLLAYLTIPKEAEPDVKIPIIYVQLSQRGISPEDSERLLLRPVETQLKSVGNVKEMRSTAFEGGGFVLLEFEAGFDSKSALADVRLVTGETAGGRIRFVAKTASTTTRTYRVEIELPNKDGKIPDGITAEVMVPQAAVMPSGIAPSALGNSTSTR